MSKKFSKSDIAATIATVATCGVVLPTIFFVLPVLNYNLPAENSEDLHNQHFNVRDAENNYGYTMDKIIHQGRDSLRNDRTYMGLMDQMYKLEEVGYDETNSKEYANLRARADLIEEEIINERLNKSEELEYADRRLSEERLRLRAMQRDSVVRDSILSIPVAQRFRTNLLQKRIDANKAMKGKAEQRLQVLQKKLQHVK